VDIVSSIPGQGLQSFVIGVPERGETKFFAAAFMRQKQG
jgi:hypothetical protein